MKNAYSFGLLLAVALIALPCPVAQAAPRKLFADVVPLPPYPDSAWERVVAAQHAEASLRPPMLHAPSDDPTVWYAANFAGLGNPSWEIGYEDITVDLKPSSSELWVEADVTVKAHKAVDSLAMLTMGTTALQLTDSNGGALKADVQKLSGYTAFTIALPAPLTPEADWTFHLSAKGKLDCSPQGIGLLPCGLGSNYQWATFTHYYVTAAAAHSPFASTLHVLAPNGKIAIAPGEPIGSDPTADGRKVWHFKQIERTDNAGFAIADYVETDSMLLGTKPLRVFTTAKYAPTAVDMAKMASEVVAAYSAQFVPFAWPGLSLIQLEKDFGGGYSPLSGVFMYRDAFAGNPNSNFWESNVELTAHEIGHQWWGNLVEPLGSGDVALSESLAEISSCLYTEKVFDSRAQIIRNNLSYLYQVTAGQDVAVGSPSVFGTPAYVEIVYHKGSVVFDTLRNEIGTDKVLAALALYATDFARDFAELDDLRKAAEKVSGKDLTWFWSQWLEHKGAVEAEVSGRLVEKDGKFTVRLRVAQPQGKPFRFTLPLTIDTPDGKSTVKTVEINPTGGETTVIVNVDVDQRPVRVRLDVQRSILRKFATGTPGDFNLSGYVDGADLVELALRFGRAMRIKGKNGQEYFYTDLSWNELYDLNPDRRIDDDDVTALNEWVGTQSEEF